ncbi:MAG TPA: NAD-dependent epimerase/dehydratase family protein [Gemmatimonadaceae bacterium]|jgi:nucleoside-diphosphate-sugar epimerase|nr:NAD-dependent epimerase/dehydratase family protein [Gemmatimonadaceae bacterium]
MRALVTGATGMVGRHIAQRLLDDGWTVRALVRDPGAEASRELDALGVHLARGDVLDQPSLVAAAGGCDVIFHAAARIFTRGWEQYRAVNIDGTRNAISAAASAGARLMHVSSVAVYGALGRYTATHDGQKTSEDLPLPPLSDHSYYSRSKRESEELVLAAHRAGRIWATAVRPDVIYGRYDRQFVPRLASVLRFGVMPLLGGGRTTLAVVHAANVADGAVRAATVDAAGGRAYNLANDFDVTAREFFAWGARGLGVDAHFVPCPVWAARAGIRTARVAVRAATLGHVRIQGAVAVNFLTRGNPFTSERARAELGWTPGVRPEDGVPDAFAWASRRPLPR